MVRSEKSITSIHQVCAVLDSILEAKEFIIEAKIYLLLDCMCFLCVGPKGLIQSPFESMGVFPLMSECFGSGPIYIFFLYEVLSTPDVNDISGSYMDNGMDHFLFTFFINLCAYQNSHTLSKESPTN